MTISDLTRSKHLRLLSPEVAAGLSEDEVRDFRARGYLMPIGGAEGDGGDGGDGDGAGAGDGDGDGAEGDGDAGSGSSSGDGDSGDDDDEDSAHDAEAQAKLATERAEKAAIQRRLAESEKARRRAERKLAEKETAAREADGEFEALYNSEKEKNEKIVSDFKDSVLKRTIVEVASRLNYRNPAVAVSLVDLDSADIVEDDFEADEKAVEKALKELAKRETYLVKTDRAQADAARAGTNGTGSGDRRQSSGGAGDGSDERVFGAARLRRVERTG